MAFAYSPAWPHGELREVLPDVFVVLGTNRTRHDGKDLQTSRTMLVVRRPEGLTLVNTVRLDDDGLRALEALGPIAHVVRLGAFHGRDDPFYRDRYGATSWALPGSMHADGRDADRALSEDSALPLDDAELLVFASSKFPEAAILLRRNGGILVTCDAIQNWSHVDRYFSPETGADFTAAGLIREANIPATWLGACEPDPADYRRLLALRFHHLVSAHGEPLLHDAHARVSARTSEVFGAPGKPRLRASAVCRAEGRVLLVRMKDPVTGVDLLFPPGGGIEAGESPAETARRETLEETGVRVRIDPSRAVTVRYPYPWAGVTYDVTTHYFAAELDEPLRATLPAVVDADYNLGAVWLPAEEAAARMAPVIADAVARVLRLPSR